MNMENIVLILIAILGCITIAGLCYWRMTIQSRIWIERGLASTDIIERRSCLRRAALLFNSDAMLAYACNNPDGFVKPKLLPFDYYIGFHHIPCIFADHYFAKGLTKWLSEEQKAFMKRIYAFKGLEEDCEDLVEEAIQKLGVATDGVVVIFMPCSNDVRFKEKFQHLSWKLKEKGYEANHMTYPYLSVRNQMSEVSSQKDLMTHVRRIVGVDNRKVIVVDDVLNTGATLKAFVKEMAKYNTKIVGAVFVSKVFNPPKPGLWTWLRIALHKENGANKLKRP